MIDDDNDGKHRDYVYVGVYSCLILICACTILILSRCLFKDLRRCLLIFCVCLMCPVQNRTRRFHYIYFFFFLSDIHKDKQQQKIKREKEKLKT